VQIHVKQNLSQHSLLSHELSQVKKATSYNKNTLFSISFYLFKSGEMKYTKSSFTLSTTTVDGRNPAPVDN